VAVAMPVIMIVVLMVVIVVVMIVMLAHASFPLAGSAICSSISFRTSLICASAAE
jgi:cytochrome c oxidase assembly protein Cox11